MTSIWSNLFEGKLLTTIALCVVIVFVLHFLILLRNSSKRDFMYISLFKNSNYRFPYNPGTICQPLKKYQMYSNISHFKRVFARKCNDQWNLMKNEIEIQTMVIQTVSRKLYTSKMIDHYWEKYNSVGGNMQENLILHPFIMH